MNSFSDRLQKMIDDLGLNVTQFSNQIGVQRSGISHLLSGRNKPGFEFFERLIFRYPEVDVYWLISGKQNPNGETKVVEQIVNEPLKVKKVTVYFENNTFTDLKNVNN